MKRQISPDLVLAYRSAMKALKESAGSDPRILEEMKERGWRRKKVLLVPRKLENFSRLLFVGLDRKYARLHKKPIMRNIGRI